MRYNEYSGIQFDDEDYKQLVKNIFKDLSILFENGLVRNSYDLFEQLNKILEGDNDE